MITADVSLEASSGPQGANVCTKINNNRVSFFFFFINNLIYFLLYMQMVSPRLGGQQHMMQPRSMMPGLVPGILPRPFSPGMVGMPGMVSNLETISRHRDKYFLDALYVIPFSHKR